MISAVSLLKSRGATDIRALVLVAAPEGIAALAAAHPDVRGWTAAIDSHLNENGYILPGSGRRRRPHLRDAIARLVAARQSQVRIGSGRWGALLRSCPRSAAAPRISSLLRSRAT